MQKKDKQAWWTRLGPGLITGASDDDPSGIATYSQAGAAFGVTTLWTAFLTWPLMASIQEMCARIGLVTSSGLTQTIKRHYPAYVLYLLIAFSFPAITLNIGADIAAMGAVSNMLSPSVPASLFSVFFTILLMFCLIFFPYRRIAAAMKWLCAVLIAYLAVPFFTSQNWGSLLSEIIFPDITWSRDYLLVLVGILGTTISPYLFFWQASMEVEEVNSKKIVVDKTVIKDMRKDVDVGIMFSNLVMFFIILSSGTVLHNEGITNIITVDQAANALHPLAGDLAYLLFAFGVIGTGFLAVPVLAGSLSYIISETFGWNEGLDKKFHEAKGFYIVMVVSVALALIINVTDITAFESLFYTAVLYGITAPVLILLILLIANNTSVMGAYKNSWRSNFMGIVTLLLMTTAAVLLFVF